LFVYGHDATRSMHADRKRRSAESLSTCWIGAANGEKRAGGSLMIASMREKHGAAQVSYELKEAVGVVAGEFRM
jgi:hypothetical protein